MSYYTRKSALVGVYQIRHKQTKKVYVGSSKDIEARWWYHCQRLAKGTHHSAHLQAAWNKSSPDDFEFLIIEQCPESEMFAREQFYIDILKPAYNSVTVVEGRTKQSRETKQKIGEASRRRASHLNEAEYERMVVSGLNYAERLVNANRERA